MGQRAGRKALGAESHARGRPKQSPAWVVGAQAMLWQRANGIKRLVQCSAVAVARGQALQRWLVHSDGVNKTMLETCVVCCRKGRAAKGWLGTSGQCRAAAADTQTGTFPRTPAEAACRHGKSAQLCTWYAQSRMGSSAFCLSSWDSSRHCSVLGSTPACIGQFREAFMWADDVPLINSAQCHLMAARATAPCWSHQFAAERMHQLAPSANQLALQLENRMRHKNSAILHRSK